MTKVKAKNDIHLYHLILFVLRTHLLDAISQLTLYFHIFICYSPKKPQKCLKKTIIINFTLNIVWQYPTLNEGLREKQTNCWIRRQKIKNKPILKFSLKFTIKTNSLYLLALYYRVFLINTNKMINSITLLDFSISNFFARKSSSHKKLIKFNNLKLYTAIVTNTNDITG